MAAQDLTRMSIAQVSELIASSQISPLDLVDATLARSCAAISFDLLKWV